MARQTDLLLAAGNGLQLNAANIYLLIDIQIKRWGRVGSRRTPTPPPRVSAGYHLSFNGKPDYTLTDGAADKQQTSDKQVHNGRKKKQQKETKTETTQPAHD